MLRRYYLILILLLAFLLRFYRLTQVPPGLYVDEVSIGYNAYSILKRGVDEYGERFPLWFKAFGEYKLPAYIYLTAGSMALFGKNEFAVRFPSAFFGSLTVLLTYFLVKELFPAISPRRSRQATPPRWLGLPLIASFLLAISPWHLQLSRAAFEANLALFFFVLAGWLAVLFFKNKKSSLLFLGFIFFILTAYTYNSYRLLAPLCLIFLMSLIFLKIPSKRKILVLASLLIFFLSLPFLQFSFSQKGRARFLQTSAFSEYPTSSLREKIKIYPLVFMKNYFSYFSLNFLFNFGDGIGRHQMRNFGLLSRWQFPFLLIGGYLLLKERRHFWSRVILGLILIAPLPAALSRPSPHSLRSFLLVIPLIMVVSLGVDFSWQKLKKMKMIIPFLIMIAGYEFAFYLHYYYLHYPRVDSIEWGGGYKQLVEKAVDYQKKYKTIVVNKKLGMPYIYFLFYDEQIKPIFVSDGWKRPDSLKKEPLLYISGPVEKPSDKLLDVIFLPNSANNDLFAKLWEI